MFIGLVSYSDSKPQITNTSGSFVNLTDFMKERRLLGPRLLVLLGVHTLILTRYVDFQVFNVVKQSLTSGGRRNYDDFTNGSLASASWTDITYNGCKSGKNSMCQTFSSKRHSLFPNEAPLRKIQHKGIKLWSRWPVLSRLSEILCPGRQVR